MPELTPEQLEREREAYLRRREERLERERERVRAVVARQPKLDFNGRPVR